jgi:hypothetical protein
MKRFAMTALIAAAAGAAAHAAPVTTGSGTVDFTFTDFKGSFAWVDPGFESNPSADPNATIGTVNGVQPTFNGGIFPRGLFGQEIITGDAAISGDSVTMNNGFFGGTLPNVVSFTPVSSFSNVAQGQPFKIGTLTFTNGAWFGGVSNVPVELDFTLTTHSSTSAFDQTSNDAFMMLTNVKPSSESCSSAQGQADEADFVYLQSTPALGSLRVYEPFCAPTSATDQTASVDVYYHFGSLDPDSLQNVQGDGFYSPSTQLGPLATPEPSTWVLLTFGLAAFGYRRRKDIGLGWLKSESLTRPTSQFS